MEIRQVTLSISLSSADEASRFSAVLRNRQLVNPGFVVLPGGDDFTSENEIVALAVKFIEHGGLEAVAAVAKLIAEVIQTVRGEKSPPPLVSATERGETRTATGTAEGVGKLLAETGSTSTLADRAASD